jgi:hypothetical protein
MLTTTRCVVDTQDSETEMFAWILDDGSIVADYSFVTSQDDCDDRLKVYEAIYEVTYGPRDEVLTFLAERAGCSFTPAA